MKPVRLFEWRLSDFSAPSSPYVSGIEPRRLFSCRRSSWSTVRLPTDGGRWPVRLLRARERYSSRVRFGHISFGIRPYSALAPRERYRIDERFASDWTTGPSSRFE